MASIRHDGGPKEAELEWRTTEREARFKFWFEDRIVVARISQAALDERFGPRSSPTEYLGVVIENFQHAVTDSVGRIAARRRFEPDGTVLLKPGDW